MATLTVSTSAVDADDGEDNISDDTYYSSGHNNTQSYLLFASSSGGTAIHNGMLFKNITIPNGATITSAKITVKGYGSISTTCNVKIYAEDVDDALAFSTSHRPKDATLTTAFVSWGASITQNTWLDSDDITDVVQEIIDRTGWESGNNINIAIMSNDLVNWSQIYDGKGSSTNATKLVIEYSEGSFVPQIAIF